MFILVVLNKVKRTSVYAIIQKTFLQAIGQLHSAFSCGILKIVIVWKFDGRRRFLQVNIICKGFLDACNSLDGAWGLPMTRALYCIEVCSIADYITCLKSVTIFLQFVQSSVPFYNMISICFVVVCHGNTCCLKNLLLIIYSIPDKISS